MIDLSTETPFTLDEARRFDVFTRTGRLPSTTTMYRWINSGCRGVRLETVVILGRRYTTDAAVLRFIARLSGGNVREPSPRQRQRDIERAERDLKALGV